MKKNMTKLTMLMATTASALGSCGQTAPQQMPTQEFEKLIQTDKNAVVVDIRTPEEYAEGYIPGAKNINYYDSDFMEQMEKSVDKGKTPAIYCRSGRRSAEATEALAKAGYEVADLEGGVLGWQEAGLTLTDGKYDLYTTQNGKQVKIEPLIHASIRIVYDGKEIEIDPVGTLGNRTTDYAAMPKADLILVTHEHHDHLDPQAIKTLMKADTIVIANPNSEAILGYGVAMRNGESRRPGDGIEIEAMPAYNISPDRLQFHPKGRDNGYVLTLDGLRIYIAGDTENIPEMARLKDIDIAFMPCNHPYTMTPDQLIAAAKVIKPKVLYPYHYGTTDLSAITPALAPEGIYVRICPFDP